MATKKSTAKGGSKTGGKGGGAKKASSKSAKALPSGLSMAGQTMLVQTHPQDILANLVGGCYKIVGKPINLQVCYSFDASNLTVCVTVKLAGQTIGRECLSATKPSYSVCTSIGVAKACVGLSFNTSTKCLTFTAKACYWALKWKCKSYQGRIACF
jgi:hypothetical protein